MSTQSERILELIGSIQGSAPAREITPTSMSMQDMIDSIREAAGMETPAPDTPTDEEGYRTITNVIDGDTVDIEGVGRVRLLGVQAPETVHPTKGVEKFGQEASLMAKMAMQGKKVRVQLGGDMMDGYGRKLAKLYTQDGRELNVALQEYIGFQANPNPQLSKEFAQPVPLPDGAASQALINNMGSSFFKGLIYPVSGLVPDLYASLTKTAEESKKTLEYYTQQRKDPNWFSSAPGAIAEFAGAAVPAAALYSATGGLSLVGEGAGYMAAEATLGTKVATEVARSAAAGGLFSALAQIEPGESRLARTARDTMIGGVTSLAFMPLMAGAWKQELAEAAQEKVIATLMGTGLSREAAMATITKVRAGATPGAAEVAEKILKVPEAKGTPLHNQAAKILETIDSVLPQDPVTIDQTLPKNIWLSFDLNIEGTPNRILMPKAATHQDWLDDVKSYRDWIAAAKAKGQRVSITNPVTNDPRIWNSFVTRLVGREPKGAVGPHPKAAVEGSVSQLGNFPAVGDEVTVTTAQGTRKTVVVEPRAASPAAADEAAHDARMEAAFAGPNAKTVVLERKGSTAAAASEPQTRQESLREFRARIEAEEGVKPSLKEVRKRYNTEHKRLPVEEEVIPDKTEYPPVQTAQMVEVGTSDDRTVRVLRRQTQHQVAEGEVFHEQATPGGPVVPEGEPVTESVTKEPFPAWMKGKAGKAPAGTIAVKSGDGWEFVKWENVHVAQRAPGMSAIKKPLTPHTPDTQLSDRRGIVHMSNDTVSLEPWGGDPYFRSEEFSSIDPSIDYGRDVPFFIEADGSVTASVTEVDRFTTPTAFGGPANWAPQDRVEMSASRTSQPSYSQSKGGVEREAGTRGATTVKVGEFTDAEGKVHMEHGIRGGETVPPEFGRFPTTYTPRALRYKVEETPRIRTRDVRTAEELGIENVDPDDPFVAAAGLAFNERQGYRVFQLRTGKSTESPVSYFLERDALTSSDPHPEWATVRRFARILQKQGYDDSVPLRIRIAKDRHVGEANIPGTMTIAEAAELELPMPLTDQLFEEGAIRGATVRIKGAGADVTFADGTKIRYADHLEAMEAITRIPIFRNQPSIDEPIARAWNMGTKNGVDSWVDSGKFMDTNFYDAAVQELYAGNRPLVHFQTNDVAAVEKAMGSTDQLFPLRSGQIKMVTLTEDFPKAEVAMYDPARVASLIERNRTQLKALGVKVSAGNTPKSLDDVVRQLYHVPNGLDILQNADTDSAVMFSWYRQHSMKPNWEMGKEALDGGRPVRIFPDEVKKTFQFKVCK